MLWVIYCLASSRDDHVEETLAFKAGIIISFKNTVDLTITFPLIDPHTDTTLKPKPNLTFQAWFA